MNSINLKLLRTCSSAPMLKKIIWSNRKTILTFNRCLFTPQSFKLDSFKNSRVNFTAIKDIDEFKNTMNIKCEGDIDYLIFIEELRNMMMITNTDDDIKLLLRMVKKYNSQTSVIRFGSFSIGPEIMRLFYVLNKPEIALDLLKDPEMSNIFNEIASLLMLGDLLFKNGMYEEGIAFFHLVENKQFQKKKYIPNLVILFFASCYKLNSSKSYEEATKKVELFEIDFLIPVRALFFYSALALNQKDPEKAIKTLSLGKEYPVGTNIKILALLEKKEFDKIFELMQNILSSSSELFDSQSTTDNSNFITEDTLQHVEKVLTETNNETQFKIFENIKEQLNSFNLISTQPLENYLLQEIEHKIIIKENKRKLRK